MPTLSAMFRIYDGYSAQVNKFIGKSNKAAESVLRASHSTDTLNNSMAKTGQIAGNASSGINKLIGAVVTLATAQKAMDLTDSYTNTSARLAMVNDGMQTQAELQDKIYAAADRARGSYTDMAAAVSKLNLLAGDSFGSNDEAILFTELLQKSLKVSGASKGEQDSAFLQLTQAMAAGKLQGDEFRSVMDAAPMVAQAIAGYMGVTKGELKELSSKGVVTADIIKSAMFGAADDINGKFESMPMTFGDVWNKIKNDGKRAFEGVFKKLNDALNSVEGQKLIDGITVGLQMAGEAIENLIDGAAKVYDFFKNNWSEIAPIVMGVVTALAALEVAQGLVAVAQGVVNAELYACPLVWIAAIIGVLVAVVYYAVDAFNDFAGTAYSATGVICGFFMSAAAAIGNLFVAAWNIVVDVYEIIWNLLASLANFVGNFLRDPIGSVCRLFFDLVDTILGLLQTLASALDSIFGFDMASGIQGWRDDLGGWVDDTFGPEEQIMEKVNADNMRLGRFDNEGAWDTGYNFGKGMEDKLTSMFDGLSVKDEPAGTGSDPTTVEGTGKGGSVEVNMADEDIQYMRDLAQRDYIAKIANNTLAPNLYVNFTGPITQEADVNKVASRLNEILMEETAACAEGVY